MKSLRVLVTAVGGDLGQALVKALRLMDSEIFVVGTDIRADVAGEAFVDYFTVIPPVTDPTTWLGVLEGLCRKYDVQAVIPGCEPEMRLLGRAFPDGIGPSGTVVVAQAGTWFEHYSDKLSCMEALSSYVDLAPFANGSDRDSVLALTQQTGWPVVVKPRRASGSSYLTMANNEAELLAALESCPEPLAQGYIDNCGGEFSVGVFACDEFCSAVAFRRELGHGGASWFADNADQDPDVLNYCLAVAKATGLRGSCNVQVRKSTRGVRLLEINPRFSSLVAARAVCGYTDLEWSLKMVLGLSFGPPPKCYRHVRFLRFVHELVDFGQGFGGLEDWKPRSVELKV